MHGFVVDTGEIPYREQENELRQKFVDTLTGFLRDVELSEKQERDMLLAIYDYQEHILAIHDERDRIWDEVVEEERAEGNDIREQRPGETWQELRLRRYEVAGKIFTRWQPSQELDRQLRFDLNDALFRILGPEEHRTWTGYCGGITCLDGIAFGGKFDTISIPGREHLHTCKEFDPCMEQREMGIVR